MKNHRKSPRVHKQQQQNNSNTDLVSLCDVLWPSLSLLLSHALSFRLSLSPFLSLPLSLSRTLILSLSLPLSVSISSLTLSHIAFLPLSCNFFFICQGCFTRASDILVRVGPRRRPPGVHQHAPASEGSSPEVGKRGRKSQSTHTSS